MPKYRGVDSAGKAHEFEHMPLLTHCLVITSSDGSTSYNFTDSFTRAELVKKNVEAEGNAAEIVEIFGVE